MKFDETCNQLVEAMDSYFTSHYTPPEDAYKFDPKGIPPEGFEQTTYWYDRTGTCHKISDMNIHHVWGAMKFIKEHIPQQLDSPLYNSLKAEYIKLRAKQFRDPVFRRHFERRHEILGKRAT